MATTKTIRRAMTDFLDSLNAQHTRRTYATPIKHFSTYLAGQGIDVERAPTGALTVDHAIGFVPWLRHDCFPDPDLPAKATLQLYLTAIYRFYRSLLKGGTTFEAADIARLEETYRDARNIRGEPRPKDPKLAAVQAIVRAARDVPSPQGGEGGNEAAHRRRELTRLRDIAIVETLRSTGCRVGELVGMRRGDLDWLTHSALVKGKGTKYRKVYLDETAWRALKSYLQARKDGEDARGLARVPVFCGHGNRSGRRPAPLTTRHVSRLIQDLAQKADIAEVGVTPHYFRHVFATRALDRTENLALVQDMLGHASPATTRVYARTDETQRREGYARVWEEETFERSPSRRRSAGTPSDRWMDSEGTEGTAFESTVPVLEAVRIPREREGGGGAGTEGPAAMLALLGATGCSLGEVVALRLGDVDVAARCVRIPAPAGLRVIRLDDRAWAVLERYLASRPGSALSGTMLFSSPEGTELSSEDALAQLRAYASQTDMGETGLYRLL
jgi:site-specific recombinase XerD